MNKFFAKATAVVMAMTLAAAPLTVSAASDPSAGSSNRTESSSSSSHRSSSKGGSSTSTASVKSTPSVVTTGGVVSSTVGGSYTATVVNGTAVLTPKSEINTAFGLKNGETAAMVVCNTRAGKAAMKSLTDAAAALGLGMGPIFDVAAMATSANGSRTIGSFTQISMVAGIPASMRMEGAEYAIIRVIPGGQINILLDADSDPNTITFNTDASGTYMLVAAPAGYFAALAAINTAN